MESLQTIITKYASKEKDAGKLKGILRKSLGKIVPLGIIMLVIFSALSLPLSYFFKIPYLLLILSCAFIFGSILVPITRGILQGQRRFYALGFSIMSEGIVKVVLAILLVLLGLGVYGAVGGVIAGIYVSFLASLFYLKKIISSEESPVKLEGIRGYSWPVLVTTFVLIAFFNIDVLLAGYFFNSTDAGIYAVVSTLATIIFVGIQPINKVLFPITAGESQAQNSARHFKKAFCIIFVCIMAALLVIWFFPSFLVELFSNKSIPEAESILFIQSLGVSCLSITSLILFYKLSRGRTKGYLFLLAFLAIEAILMSFFSYSLFAFSSAFLASTIIFLIGSFLVFNR